MRLLLVINLAFAVLAAIAPLAHLIELPNKFALDGSLWLAVQQQLYRGWGPFFGGPAEIGAMLTSTAALFLLRRRGCAVWPMQIACAGYAGMLAAFFLLNRPVNLAVSTWSPSTVPPDRPSYRFRWELGHAIAAVLALISLTAVASGWRRATRTPAASAQG